VRYADETQANSQANSQKRQSLYFPRHEIPPPRCSMTNNSSMDIECI
jgi:hypothetical protein